MFSIDQIMEQITELLHSYRQYHLQTENMEQEEKQHCEERAVIARDTFRAMFQGRLENEKFLTDESEDSVLGTLRSWAQEMRPAATDGGDIRYTAEDCSALLIQLTSEQSSGQDPPVWPYIRKIKFV